MEGKITYDIAGCASLGSDLGTKIGLMYRPLLCATLNGQENVRIVVCMYSEYLRSTELPGSTQSIYAMYQY